MDDDIPDSVDWDEGLHPEGPSAADLERFGDEYKRCPNCHADVYDQAELCHACGHHFQVSTGNAGKWLILIAVIALLAFLMFVIP